jgi:hypothetical protein
VVATIVVGLVTYWLTASSENREYRERIKAARSDALIAVVRSIGEGVVPDREKIDAVIRSIRRQYGIRQEDFETSDTVIDDILARVMANEFLDAKRREELSSKLLVAKRQANAEPDTKPQAGPRKTQADQVLALMSAITAAALASATILAMAARSRARYRAMFETDENDRSFEVIRRRDFFRQMVYTLIFLTAIVLIVTIFAQFGPEILPGFHR